MSRWATHLLLAVVLLLMLGTVATVVLAQRTPGSAARSQEFQELVGGLGFGPATELSEDASTFDPRVCPTSPGDLGPLPAGREFSTRQACSIFAYPPLKTEP